MNLSSFFRMFGPKDKKFMTLLQQDADNLVKAAILFNKYFLIDNLAEQEQIIRQIKDHERAGDDITHQTFDELNRSFITPFDREDIYSMNTSLDDILDFINAAAIRFRLYRPKMMIRQFLEMSELIMEVCREVRTAINCLNDLNNPQATLHACEHIFSIESKADRAYHGALCGLFDSEADAIELIKAKDILEVMEEAMDKAEDVAEAIKAVVIKMA